VTGLLALAALQLADVGTTLIGLARGATETGAIAAPALRAFGLTGLILLPLVGVVVQLAVLHRMPRRFRKAGWTVVLGMAVIPVAANALVLA
jgi:uncharacterized protein YqgC (DUF456 family)